MKIKHYAISALIYVFALQSHAFSWQDLWQSKNQQAKNLMKKNDFSAAQNTFKNEDWRAVAAFRAKDYQQAANLFAKSNTTDANYNLGNALAHLGKYQEALAAYNKVLAENKNHQDAKHNKKIIEKLLQQQKKQEEKKQSENKNKQNTNQPKSPEEKNDSNSKNQESKNQPKENRNNPEEQKQPKGSPKPKNSNGSNANQLKKRKKHEDKTPEDGNNQMQEQWLKLIPDDPGGLLREKFKRDYLRRRGELNQ